MKIFQLNNVYSIVCEWKKTRMAFKHEAVITKNGSEVCKTKICYQNRTWERYEYQSVIHKAIGNYFKGVEAKELKRVADNIGDGQCRAQFAPILAICAMGELLAGSEKEAVDFKKRILETLPGVSFPKDFDGLQDEEKARRINGALDTVR